MRSYRTLSPLPPGLPKAVYSLRHFPSRYRGRALPGMLPVWSPDFPPPADADGGCPPPPIAGEAYPIPAVPGPASEMGIVIPSPSPCPSPCPMDAFIALGPLKWFSTFESMHLIPLVYKDHDVGGDYS